MLGRIQRKVSSLISAVGTIEKLLVELVYFQRLASHRNPFAKQFARKYTSQSDEDGITLEICRRVGLNCNSTFVEIGVGDGTENNTLSLLLHGWHGFWIGCEDLKFSKIEGLQFLQQWLTLDNISELFATINSHLLPNQSINLLSIDTDGNDIHFLRALLLDLCIKPEVIICEYNAFFPPSVEWEMSYSSNHNWKSGPTRDIYFGASLLSFKSFLADSGYKLVACNPHTGANAFFVRDDYSHLFPEVPQDISDIYVAPFYSFTNKFGYAFTEKVLKSKPFLDS